MSKITYTMQVGNTSVEGEIDPEYLDHDGSLAGRLVSTERLKHHLFQTFLKTAETERERVSR